MPRVTGTYESVSVGEEVVQAFVPDPLPPARPALKLTGALGGRIRDAERALSNLQTAGQMVPSIDWFVYSFVRKEAVVSCQIEGAQASLTDLLTAEAEAPSAAAPEDVEEICNYLEALNYARTQIRRSKGLRLSLRLLDGAHRRLLSGAREQPKRPGSVRKSQNWIGGAQPGNARFVPPPPDHLPDLLSELERFLNQSSPLPAIVRTGLAHVQFETIHPYLDGNGRVGRLLIALCLEDWGLLDQPLLYLSHFFKQSRTEYDDRLERVRTHGDWEGWLDYFLEGVAVVASEAVDLIRSLQDLIERDRARYLESDRATITGVRLLGELPRHPVVTVKLVAQLCETTRPTAAKAVDSLCAAGILREISGRKRDMTYAYGPYLDLLSEGTEVGT